MTAERLAKFVMVPREPTEAMIEAARMTLPGPVDICDADIEDIYLTMIDAAPPVPDVVERVARAICQEECAYRGEPPCFRIESTWPNPNCGEPGCHSLARAALAAISK